VNPINVMSRPISLFIAQPYCRGQCGGNVKMWYSPEKTDG
jgi:hypothetical protein